MEYRQKFDVVRELDASCIIDKSLLFVVRLVSFTGMTIDVGDGIENPDVDEFATIYKTNSDIRWVIEALGRFYLVSLCRDDRYPGLGTIKPTFYDISHIYSSAELYHRKHFPFVNKQP